MSHINYIGGNLTAAADYQEYLAILRADRRTRRNTERWKKRGGRKFGSATDPDRESAGDLEGKADRVPGGEPDGFSDVSPDGDVNAGSSRNNTFNASA